MPRSLGPVMWTTSGLKLAHLGFDFVAVAPEEQIEVVVFVQVKGRPLPLTLQVKHRPVLEVPILCRRMNHQHGKFAALRETP